VFYTPAPAGDPEAWLYALLAHDFPLLRPVRKLPSTEKGTFVSARRVHDVQSSYRPPDLESLRYCGHGLTADQRVALQSSREELVMDFQIRGEPPWKALRAACEVASRIVRETGGLLWDDATREIFSPAAWDRTRLATWAEEIPDVARHTTIHLYRMKESGESLRAVTLGMAKLGLPDVAVEGFSSSSARAIGNLIDSLDQALAEGAQVGRRGELSLRLRDLRNRAVREREVKGLKRGAKGEARLRLLAATKAPGDAENRLITISLDRYPGPDRSAQMSNLLESLFGAEDATVFTAPDDQELLAASRAAAPSCPPCTRSSTRVSPPTSTSWSKPPSQVLTRTPNGCGSRCSPGSRARSPGRSRTIPPLPGISGLARPLRWAKTRSSTTSTGFPMAGKKAIRPGRSSTSGTVARAVDTAHSNCYKPAMPARSWGQRLGLERGVAALAAGLFVYGFGEELWFRYLRAPRRVFMDKGEFNPGAGNC
jgi:hypothetical protein